MTLSALLLAAAVLTPSTGPATVPTGIRPPVSVGTPISLGCGEIGIPIQTGGYVELTGWHDIGDIPPFGTRGMTLHVRRSPGETIRYGIAYLDGTEPIAEGTVTFPPCLGEAIVVVDDTVEITTPARIEARRGRFWTDTLKRWGAW